MNLIALGSHKLYHSEEVLREKIRQSLHFLEPRQVISDYAYGWNLLVAEVAQTQGVSVVGAIPYKEIPQMLPPSYLTRRLAVERHARTNTIFNTTAEKFTSNPQPYIEWVIRFSNEVLAYFPPSYSSFSYSLMVALTSKHKYVFDMYGGL